MSVINKMLQELDRRQGGVAVDGAPPPPAYVRSVKPLVEHRPWFWATLGVLISAAIGWTGWVAYQLSPRALATEAAFRSMDEARNRQTTALPAPVAAPAAAPAPTAPAAPPAVATPTPAAPAPAPVSAAPTEPPSPVPQAEMLRLAESIATPILESKPPVETPAARPKPESKPAAASKPAAPPPIKLAAVAPAKTSDKPRLERQDRLGTAAERAENEFRHAASVLRLGRSSDAESHFIRALEFDPAHKGARQALVAMHLERGQLEMARKLLQDGLNIDPGQPEFAITLARIYVERKDLSSALSVLERSAGAAGEVPEFHVLRGTLLQRLSRHAEAADAYQTALQARDTFPQAWVGLGISLEALNRRSEAADAFKRALIAGPMSADVKTFAEQRVRALR